MFKFRKLIVYKLAKELVKNIYAVTDKFPKKELFNLVSQINRAAVSVASNIAEGVSRSSEKDRAHFINMSYCSLMEVICQLEISFELGYVDEYAYNEIMLKVQDLSVRLNNFQKSINKTNNNG